MDECQQTIERFPTIARKLWTIRTEEEGFRRIEPNKVQLHYHRDRVLRGFGSRDDILKARKHGITTWKVLEGLTLALLIDGFSGAVVLHEKETSSRVFKICRWAYDRLPAEYKRERKLNEDRRDAIDFGGSTLYVYTAGARAMARSETFHWAHMSEVAFWPDPVLSLPGITEAVPRFGHICQESTPNGRDNYWYGECMAAREGQLPNTKLHFYPWWWGDENSLPLEPGEVIIPTDEEQDIIAIAANSGFSLSREQLKWRRSKLANPLTGHLFYQEHPEDINGCFLMKGASIIDPRLLQRFIQSAEAMLKMEDIWLPGNGAKIHWRNPNGTDPYIVAVDVAEGKAHGDWSVISTWQNKLDGLVNIRRQKIRCTPDELAVRVVDEARECRDALVIVERNAIGGEVVRKIEEQGYYNQYHQLNLDGDESTHMGWYSNARTKKAMVESWVAEVNSGGIISYDAEMWSQVADIVRDDNGNPVFPAKKHDDLVIAAMLANMARDQSYRRSGGNATVVSYA